MFISLQLLGCQNIKQGAREAVYLARDRTVLISRSDKQLYRVPTGTPCVKYEDWIRFIPNCPLYATDRNIRGGVT